jgi:mannose-6-phosphate isomerase-like protein (cupin superfamily)
MPPDKVQVLAPGEGETIRPGFEIKIGRPELVLTEARYAVGDMGPDPHVHHDHVDSFFVLEGQLEWRVGPDLEPHTGGAGTFVSVPRDVLHTFRNPGPSEARFLNLHAPGCGFERYLRGDYPDFDQHYMPEGSGLAPTEVIVLGPGEGERLELGESVMTIKLGCEELAVFEGELGAGFPHPPAHRHLRTLECWYVLEGAFGVDIGGVESTVPADGFAAAAPGAVHSSPPSDPVRLLNLFAPGGLEGLVREAARSGEPDVAAYDIELAN